MVSSTETGAFWGYVGAMGNLARRLRAEPVLQYVL